MSEAITFTTVCYNRHCGVKLAQNRIDAQSTQISNKWFCVKCLRKGASSVPLEYECARKDCDNIIARNGIAHKYCSNDCKRRVLCGTQVSKQKTCVLCGESFMTKMGYPQKYCSTECRLPNNNVKYRNEHSKRYRPRTGITRSADIIINGLEV